MPARAGERGERSLRVTPAFPRQEETQEKKLKRREKLKRRSKAAGEQAQPEESELGDGDLEPPLPKKTKEAKEKSNGLAGERDGSKRVVKPSSAVSSDVTSLAAQSASGNEAAGEQDSDAEVVTLCQRSLCLAQLKSHW